MSGRDGGDRDRAGRARIRRLPAIAIGALVVMAAGMAAYAARYGGREKYIVTDREGPAEWKPVGGTKWLKLDVGTRIAPASAVRAPSGEARIVLFSAADDSLVCLKLRNRKGIPVERLLKGDVKGRSVLMKLMDGFHALLFPAEEEQAPGGVEAGQAHDVSAYVMRSKAKRSLVAKRALPLPKRRPPVQPLRSLGGKPLVVALRPWMETMMPRPASGGAERILFELPASAADAGARKAPPSIVSLVMYVPRRDEPFLSIHLELASGGGEEARYVGELRPSGRRGLPSRLLWIAAAPAGGGKARVFGRGHLVVVPRRTYEYINEQLKRVEARRRGGLPLERPSISLLLAEAYERLGLEREALAMWSLILYSKRGTDAFADVVERVALLADAVAAEDRWADELVERIEREGTER